MRLLLAAVAVLGGGFALDRLLLVCERRGWIYYRTRKPTRRSVGTAFLEMQATLEPEKRHVLDVREIDERREPEPDDRDRRSPDRRK